MKIGYFLSSEEWGPRDLVAQAVKAQQAGFDRLWISDHYHPWNDQQGHSRDIRLPLRRRRDDWRGRPRRAHPVRLPAAPAYAGRRARSAAHRARGLPPAPQRPHRRLHRVVDRWRGGARGRVAGSPEMRARRSVCLALVAAGGMRSDPSAGAHQAGDEAERRHRRHIERLRSRLPDHRVPQVRSRSARGNRLFQRDQARLGLRQEPRLDLPGGNRGQDRGRQHRDAECLRPEPLRSCA